MGDEMDDSQEHQASRHYIGRKYRGKDGIQWDDSRDADFDDFIRRKLINAALWKQFLRGVCAR